MSPLPLFWASVLAVANLAIAQKATFPATPLVNKHWASPTNLPYKVDTDTDLLRGPQTGYNICNSTTEGPGSMCQTSYLNSVDDFCLWAPPQPNSHIAAVEGEMVAWCSRPGHGTRIIPAGAITGLQFMRTPDYVQVTGFIKQGMMNMIDGESGGEMDGGGADLRGNPMGAAIFSDGFAGGKKGTYVHAPHWHNFMGSNTFCFKVCDPKKKNAAHYCEHIYDRIGCEYNAPSRPQQGVFEYCEGENQDFPGVYKDANGAQQTYTQPPEELGPISTMPYTARIPASSNCQPFESAKLFAGAINVSTAPPASTTSVSSSTSISSSAPPSSSTTSSLPTVAPTTSSSPTSSGAAPTGSGNAAETVVVSGMAGLVGVVFAAIFFS